MERNPVVTEMYYGIKDVYDTKLCQKNGFLRSFIKIWLFLAVFLYISNSYAKEKLPLPRFASIKSNEVNVRTGPSVRYPIKWIYTSRNEPVEILAEFEQWRKIRDFSKEEGWVHESMLSGKRFGIISAKEKQILYKNQADTTHPLVIVEPGVKVKIQECSLDWCRVIVKNYKGWIRKDKLYGVYKNELYK